MDLIRGTVSDEVIAPAWQTNILWATAYLIRSVFHLSDLSVGFLVFNIS